MPEKSFRGRKLGNLDLDGPGKKPYFINLGKEGIIPEAEPHRVQHNELPQERLSKELIPGPMKVLKIATAGLAVQRDIYR